LHNLLLTMLIPQNWLTPQKFYPQQCWTSKIYIFILTMKHLQKQTIQSCNMNNKETKIPIVQCKKGHLFDGVDLLVTFII
jgi:hypothetical protein